MSRRYSIFLSLLFCAFVGGLGLAGLLLPDRAASELENRALAQAPALSLRALADGSFMDRAEDYAADQFPLRDLWVLLHARLEQLSGKRENGGVYFGKEDTLLKRLDEPDWAKAERDMGCLNALAENAGVPVYFGLIPTAAALWAGRLPEGAPSADQRSAIDRLYALSRAETVDLYAALEAHSGEDIYYRTDHHWTSLGAYYGCAALAEALGLESISRDSLSPAVVSRDFLGTLYSASRAGWIPPDSIEMFVPEDAGLEVTSWHTGKPRAGALYAWDRLQTKDKYAFFLGGIQPLCVIRSGDSSGPRVLVVRDSYCDSLAPLLALGCSELHLWDFRGNLDSLKSYIGENGIDRVLVLYSLPNFLEDRNLFLLAR